MNVREFIKNNITVLDGGMGTILQKNGLKTGEKPEYWNISHSDIITQIHKSYFDAGSNIVCANTFGANILNFSETELDEIIKCAVENARKAEKLTASDKEKFVALDIGPLGKLLKPYGEFDFEEAVSVFSKTVKSGEKYGVDLFFIETMNDSLETKAAVIAVKENSKKPVFVSNAYGSDGKLMTGATPEVMIAMLEGMGADVIGVNCSLAPKDLEKVIDKYLQFASVPVLFKPNAGLPVVKDGITCFDVEPEEFCIDVIKQVNKGVRLIGGCCGTNPDYIKLLNDKIKKCNIKEITDKNLSVVSSYTHIVTFSDKTVLIGERINPTGKKRFRQALIENDIGYILKEGIGQQEKGANILDVNVGLPDIDEKSMLKTAVYELQTVTDLPLQIDSSDYVAVEKALRIYNGKALLNSVNGKKESMDNIFPLVKKYGGMVVALTLDENGIPDNAKGRTDIAEKIIAEAETYGIKKKDIIFDPLAMTVSASQNSALITLECIKYINNVLGCKTILGVSNISFGLPDRDYVTGSFFISAMENGLSAAIMNPYSFEMMKCFHSYNVLHGFDVNCEKYIDFCNNTENVNIQCNTAVKKNDKYNSDLQRAIIKGLKNDAENITAELLKIRKPIDIINNEIIPALNIVGDAFEKKTVYLPQLLISAETAGVAFEKIKSVFGITENEQDDKIKIILATVKGDIHDIGKNIVKLLLENYGFNVIDLGKDVEPEKILECAIDYNVNIVGLSALMTTTVPAMEDTIRLIKEHKPDCKIIVGGAVLNKEYAKKIGSDFYAGDAMETVKIANSLI